MPTIEAMFKKYVHDVKVKPLIFDWFQHFELQGIKI